MLQELDIGDCNKYDKRKNMMMLTVITPTYNRGKKLLDCYKSLTEQTCKSFVWMVIDDGSVDNTEIVISEWKKEKKINIIYIKKENGGKASALNIAFQNLTTPYACCLDSDDIFCRNAVELALMELEKIKNDNMCCGIVAISSYLNGMPIGGAKIPQFFKTICISDLLKLGKGTECIRFYKTDILKNYSFPTYPGEKFVSPSWLDYEINRKYYFVPSRNIFCLCEYLPDGLTKNKSTVIVKNPHGYTAVKKNSFEFATSIKEIIKQGIMYDCGCIMGKDKDWLKNAPKKFWAFILRPLAWGVYFVRFQKIMKVFDDE